MSDHDVDPFYLELVARDEAFRYGVQDFMQHHVPGVITPFLRGALHNLVFSYYNTSQDIQLQGLLLDLHDMYGLQGLMDMTLLESIRERLNPRAIMNPMEGYVPASSTQDKPAALSIAPGTEQQQSSLSAASQYQAGHGRTGTNPSAHGSGDSADQPAIDSSAANQPGGITPVMSGVSNSTSTTSPPPTIPPQTVATARKGIIDARDKNWTYKCDACGHEILYRSEFHRHNKVALGRVGFRITKADPESETLWYATDAAGNDYVGELVSREGSEGRRTARKMELPCGPRIRAYWKRLHER